MSVGMHNLRKQVDAMGDITRYTDDKLALATS